MQGVLIRWLILTGAILIASYIIDGINISGFFSAVFAAAMLGILNAFFRPILFILTLPINLVTFGLFTFVINAMMLKMASAVIPGFDVYGFWPAIFGSLLISVTSWLLTSFVNERGRIEYIELKKRRDGHWER